MDERRGRTIVIFLFVVLVLAAGTVVARHLG